MPRNEPLAVAVIAAPETAASTVFGLYDLFSSAGRDWDLLMTGRAGTPRALPLIVAAGIEPFVTANGAWIRPDRKRCYDAGATLASACSGALLLAEAGLLDGCEATTHWAYCDDMRRSYPRVVVHPARCLVASGDGQRPPGLRVGD